MLISLMMCDLDKTISGRKAKKKKMQICKKQVFSKKSKYLCLYVTCCQRGKDFSCRISARSITYELNLSVSINL